MSPSTIDVGVVQARLTVMRDLLADLDHVGDVSAGRLMADRLLRHGVERILGQLVDLATSVNSHIAAEVLERVAPDYRTSFDLAVEAGLLSKDTAEDLKPSAGPRNVLAHEYVTVDLNVVAAAIPLARAGYGRYVAEVARWLADRTSQGTQA